MRWSAVWLVLMGCWSTTPQPTRITVLLPYPGVSALDAQSLVARPAERTLAAVDGVRGLLSTCEPGMCTLEVEIGGGQDFQAIQSVSQALDRVQFPADAEGHRVFLAEVGRVWVRAGAGPELAHEAIGALSRSGKGASVLVDPPPDEVWTVRPERLGASGVAPQQLGARVDAALGGGAWAGGETVLGRGITLGQLAERADAQTESSAFVDGGRRHRAPRH